MSLLNPDLTSGRYLIREQCGLAHERQVVAMEVARDWGEVSFRDEGSGEEFSAQRSWVNPEVAFVYLGLMADSELRLVAQAKAVEISNPVTLSAEGVVSNGKWAAEIFLGEWNSQVAALPGFEAPTPVLRVRVGDGAWRGSSFFDTRYPVRRVTGTVLESGPLRVVTRFRAEFDLGHFYEATLTFDAGADFFVIDERFENESGDQIVWDFSGADLPRQIHRLDSTAGFQTQSLHYFFDRRLARLACWNQYSQLHDFSDGYAFDFANGDDAIGFVALKGGDWDGNAHNFMEAWTRRWLPGDPGSRRLVPPEAKADAWPSSEVVPARPVNLCEEHFSVEGWLHRGRRIFTVVLCSANDLRPAEWNEAPPLGAFEYKPDRTRYLQQQSLLRRIHTQHGMFPLADQLTTGLSWPVEAPPRELGDEPPWAHPDPLTFLPPGEHTIASRREQIFDFLAARVYGFWEGSGSAYTNAVVNRRLVEDLIAWEWLAAKGHLSDEQMRRGRAWFAFLAHLCSSDHYYPGPALMNMGGDGKRLEPTIAGMANQNFFTDVFNFPGMAAQIFHGHPQAAFWSERFSQMWQRQLEYHVYPESGIWEESHTYFHHVLQTLLPTFFRRREDGLADEFTRAPFQKMVASLLKMMTPKDACFGGKRHVVALGDHGVDLHDLYRPLYLILAENIAGSNPDLAAHLAWAYVEMGGTEKLPVEPRAIDWKNEYVQGLGYFFRGRDESGESLMVLRCGSSWAHHHNDEGSLQFFHAGRAWIVDSAFSYSPENGIRKFSPAGHSRWSPTELNPLNYLWQFNRGWISRHEGERRFPYAIAHTPAYMAETPFQQYIPLRTPILHRRAVVRLTPSAFLIFDYTDIPLAQVTRFHVPSDAPLVLDDAPCDGMHLRLLPLLGLRAGEIVGTDRPTQAGEAYATREVRFAWKDCPVTALLVTVDSAPVSVQHDGNTIDLLHAEFTAKVIVRNAEITLVDSASGAETKIRLDD